jgi:ribose 5-phosphate isomerase B
VKVAVGSDHAGWALKEHLRGMLAAASHEIVDCGTDSDASCDYPRFAVAVALAVAEGRAERGLLVCGTGIGMAMAANRVPGIRAANCNDLYTARLARLHNDANVLTVGSRVVATAQAEAILAEFLAAPFEGGRHRQRLEQLAALD